MPLTAAAMMAAGYSAQTAALTEGATWVAPPLAYYAYRKTHRNKKSNEYVEPMIPLQGTFNRKRVHTGAGVGPTKYKKARRKTYPRKGTIYRGLAYNKANDMNTHFQVLTDAPETLSITSGTDKFGCVVPSMLPQCPGFPYWKGLFERYKIVWVKVQFRTSINGIIMMSHCSLDSTTLDTDLDNIMKSPSLRQHDLTEVAKHSAQRTLKLSGAQDWKDFLDCDTTNADLGTYSNQVTTGGTHKFKIGYGARAYGNAQIMPVVSFGVLFRGLRDDVTIS